MPIDQGSFIDRANSLLNAMQLNEEDYPRLNEEGTCFGLSNFFKNKDEELVNNPQALQDSFYSLIESVNKITAEQIISINNYIKSSENIDIARGEIGPLLKNELNFIQQIGHLQKQQLATRKSIQNNIMYCADVDEKLINEYLFKSSESAKYPISLSLDTPKHAMAIKIIGKDEFLVYDPNAKEKPEILNAMEASKKIAELIRKECANELIPLWALEVPHHIKISQRVMSPQLLFNLSGNEILALLQQATIYNDPKVIKEIINLCDNKKLNGLSVKNEEDDPLCCAILTENHQCIEELLILYTKYQVNYHDETLLLCILTENREIFDKIFDKLKEDHPEKLAKLLIPSDGSGTLLHKASEIEIFKNIFNVINVKDNALDLLMVKDKKGKTFLHLACKYGNSRIIEYISNHLDKKGLLEILSQKDNNGKTSLHVAFEKGHWDIFLIIAKSLTKNDVEKLLLEVDKNGKTPLYLACENGRYELVSSLFSENRALASYLLENTDPDNNLLHAAVLSGNTKLLELILNKADHLIDYKDNKGITFIDIAAENKNTIVMDYLVNYINSNNRSQYKSLDKNLLLEAACKANALDAIKNLLKLGATADINNLIKNNIQSIVGTETNKLPHILHTLSNIKEGTVNSNQVDGIILFIKNKLNLDSGIQTLHNIQINEHPLSKLFFALGGEEFEQAKKNLFNMIDALKGIKNELERIALMKQNKSQNEEIITNQKPPDPNGPGGGLPPTGKESKDPNEKEEKKPSESKGRTYESNNSTGFERSQQDYHINRASSANNKWANFALNYLLDHNFSQEDIMGLSPMAKKCLSHNDVVEAITTGRLNITYEAIQDYDEKRWLQFLDAAKLECEVAKEEKPTFKADKKPEISTKLPTTLSKTVPSSQKALNTIEEVSTNPTNNFRSNRH